MIAFAAVWLFIIGLFNCFNLSVKSDKFVCGISFVSVLALILWYSRELLNFNEQTFSYLWNSSPSGDIKIDILSNFYNCMLFFPFLIMTFFAVGGNYFFRYEQKRCRYNALLLFNLIALLLMITSNNFVQLLSAVFIIDIFAVISAKNTSVCQKFIIANLLTDMLLFMLLALINGKIDSLDIRQVINYKSMGYHIDFITILGFTTLMIKMGFFPFQISLTNLNKLHFHRLNNILFLFSPVSALILLLKFNSLWSSSAYFLPYIDIVIPLVFVWGFICALFSNSLRLKAVYWQIMFFALLIELLRFHGFVWDLRISKLILAEYILFCGIYLMYYHCGRKDSLSLIINNAYQSKKGLYSALFVVSMAVFAIIQNMEDIYNNRNRYYIWTYSVLFLISFCETLHQIYMTRSKKVLTATYIKQKPLQYPYLLFLSLTGVVIMINANFGSYILWGMFAMFMILTATGIVPHIESVYQNKFLQNSDWFGRIYSSFFIKVLQKCGRLLWLIIDWKLVERLVIGIAIGILQTCLRIFRVLQTNIVWYCLFIIITILLTLNFAPFFKEMR